MKTFLLFVIFSIVSMHAQTDWERWEKSEVSYTKKNENRTRNYSLSNGPFSHTVIKIFTGAYWFLVSDLDGDNCPFQPSCSSFFVEAVSQTNFAQGTLMFIDRFTRDLNIFNRTNKYPRIGTSHLYDPVQLYTLNGKMIEYLPPNTFIKSE